MKMIALPRQFTDVLWRVVLTTAVVGLAAYVVAQQVVFPQPRIIKITVLFLLLVIMLRLQTVYSLYLFIVLMPFPSGIALTSTNVVLMTLIPLLWVVRARSMQQALTTRTPVDGAIAFFLLAYIIAFANVQGTHALVMNLKMLWRQLAALALFFLIVTFVDDEKKLSGITKAIAVSAGLLSITAIAELFAPGAALIPGWISTGSRNLGELGMRIEGMRVHGSVGSHSLVGDYVSMSLFFVVLHFLRARNPIANLFWVIVFAVSFPAVLATANRGAFVALVIGMGYSFWIFRRFLGLARVMVLIGAIVALFAAGELVLKKFTYAASITQRVMATEFEMGIVPDNRRGAWVPALEGSMEHPFTGHGPWYDLGSGLERKSWPHNAYIYNFYTLGLLGLSAMLLVRYRVFKISLEGVRKYPPGRGGGLSSSVMGILHVLFVMHVLQMGRTDFERPGDNLYIFVVWMLFGLIAATARIQKDVHAPPAGAASRAEAPR
jgi:O-antigen ligase